MGEQHDGVVVAGAELHPRAGPRIPGRSTARRESTSHNPPAQRPIPPGCTLRPSAPLTGEAALPPKAGQPGLEASTPGPVAWSWKAQSYSSLGPPRHPGSRASQASRRYATRQSWTPETKTKVPEQARAARHLVPILDHQRVDCHRPTHRGQGPRQHLRQEVAPFARAKSHHLKIHTAGPPHREMPLLGAQYMDSFDGIRA